MSHDLNATRRLLDRPLDARELHAQTEEVARPLEEDAGERVSVLIVECGGERLALPGSLVRRVSALAPVHRVPHRSNSVLRGIVNLGGHVTLAADLASLLELPKAESASTADRRMLLLGEGSEQWAVEVDRVLGVLRVEVGRLGDAPVTVRAARDHHTDRLLTLLDGEVDGGAGRVALLSEEKVLAGLRRNLG